MSLVLGIAPAQKTDRLYVCYMNLDNALLNLVLLSGSGR